jgi:hypothetical protein
MGDDIWQVDFASAIQFQTVVYGVLRPFLWVLQIGLHIAYTCDNLQHLRVESIQLLALLKRFFLLRKVTDDRGHASHWLAQILTGSFDLLTLYLQFVDDGFLPGLDSFHLINADTPEVDD